MPGPKELGRIMKPAVLVAIFALLYAPPVHAQRIAGTPTDFKDYLAIFDAAHLGVGAADVPPEHPHSDTIGGVGNQACG